MAIVVALLCLSPHPSYFEFVWATLAVLTRTSSLKRMLRRIASPLQKLISPHAGLETASVNWTLHSASLPGYEHLSEHSDNTRIQLDVIIPLHYNLAALYVHFGAFIGLC